MDSQAPVVAFDWLLTAFKSYIHNGLTWLDVREVMKEADKLSEKFHEELETNQPE